MYQIVRTSPVYCSITDGLIGSKLKLLPYSYNTLAYAEAKAGRLSQESYDNCGDDIFHVIKAGAPLSTRASQPVPHYVWSDEDIAF